MLRVNILPNCFLALCLVIIPTIYCR